MSSTSSQNSSVSRRSRLSLKRKTTPACLTPRQGLPSRTEGHGQSARSVASNVALSLAEGRSLYFVLKPIPSPPPSPFFQRQLCPPKRPKTLLIPNVSVVEPGRGPQGAETFGRRWSWSRYMKSRLRLRVRIK
jgi:hypothetical protein